MSDVQFLFETASNTSDKHLRKLISTILEESKREVKAIGQKCGVRLDKTANLGSNIRVDYKGAGIDPGTIAILISLEPLIKDLVPLVQPVIESAADVAKTIALDIWAMVKRKLWEEHNVELKESVHS